MIQIARHFTLITLEGVKALIQREVVFKVRYERVGTSPDGKPKYQCVYVYGDKEKILVQSRLTADGASARTFTIWPGLFKHHERFGDGTTLCYHQDGDVSCVQREVFNKLLPEECM